MTPHPLHDAITTVAALFPDSKLELLVLDEGTAMVECRHGTTYSSVLLDDEGRRALIVALGGIPLDKAEVMMADLETEAAEAQDKGVTELKARLHELEQELEASRIAHPGRYWPLRVTELEARTAELEAAITEAIEDLGNILRGPGAWAQPLREVRGHLVTALVP